MDRSKEDTFESRYMSEGESVRYRDKNISRKMAAVLAAPAVFVVALTIFVAITNSTSDKPIPSAALPFVLLAMTVFAAMYLFLSLTFAVLRTVVTDRAVIVKYGLWGPRVPIEAIESCRVIDYDWTKFGGWGIRRGAGGTWAYVPTSGEVVELVYRQGDEKKTVLIGARSARLLAAEIHAARAPARIETAPAATEDLALAEAEQAEEEGEESAAGRRNYRR